MRSIVGSTEGMIETKSMIENKRKIRKSFYKIIDKELELDFWKAKNLNPEQKQILEEYIKKLKKIIRKWEKIRPYLKYVVKFRYIEETVIDLNGPYLNGTFENEKKGPPDIAKVIWIKPPYISGLIGEFMTFYDLWGSFRSLKYENKIVDLVEWWTWKDEISFTFTAKIKENEEEKFIYCSSYHIDKMFEILQIVEANRNEELELFNFDVESLTSKEKFILRSYLEKLRKIIKEWEKIRPYLKYASLSGYVEENIIEINKEFLGRYKEGASPEPVMVIWIGHKIDYIDVDIIKETSLLKEYIGIISNLRWSLGFLKYNKEEDVAMYRWKRNYKLYSSSLVSFSFLAKVEENGQEKFVHCSSYHIDRMFEILKAVKTNKKIDEKFYEELNEKYHFSVFKSNIDPKEAAKLDVNGFQVIKESLEVLVNTLGFALVSVYFLLFFLLFFLVFFVNFTQLVSAIVSSIIYINDTLGFAFIFFLVFFISFTQLVMRIAESIIYK